PRGRRPPAPHLAAPGRGAAGRGGRAAPLPARGDRRGAGLVGRRAARGGRLPARAASPTLAGHTHQRIGAPAAAQPWEALVRELGLPSAQVETLRTTYRSTREIMAFARGVLGPLWEEEAPPAAVRSGPPVEIFAFTDVGSCVAFLAEALRALAAA